MKAARPWSGALLAFAFAASLSDAAGGRSVRMLRMLPRLQDPIVAIATAPGRGAVGIVRLSGQR